MINNNPNLNNNNPNKFNNRGLTTTPINIFQIKIRDGMLYLMGRQMKVGQLMVEETRVGKLILMYNATIASNGVMYQEIVLTPGLMFPIFLNVEIANKVGIPQRNVMHQED